MSVRPYTLVLALLAGTATASSGHVATAAPPVNVPPTHTQTRAPSVRSVVLPQGSSLAAAALLRYVEGPSDANEVDRSVATALARVPGGRAIASRIASRIRALPDARRQAAFGARAAHLSRAVTAADFAPLANDSLPTVGRAEVGPAASPSAAPTPAPAPAHELRLSGFASRKVADADGADEPVVVTGAIVSSGKKLSLLGFRRYPSSGVGSIVAGASVATDVIVYSGAESIVLVSALLEDDGGDADPRAAEIQLLTELAIGLATTADGYDPLVKVQARLPEAFALLRVHEDAGDTTVTSRLVRSSEWPSLVRARRTVGKIAYALESRHDTDGGDYSLYFDVRGAPAAQKPR